MVFMWVYRRDGKTGCKTVLKIVFVLNIKGNKIYKKKVSFELIILRTAALGATNKHECDQ